MGSDVDDSVIALIYVCGGMASVLCCLLVLICYAGTPALSRLSGTMLCGRLICDGILAAQFVLLNLPQLLDNEPASDASTERACSSTLAFLAQFGMFGSLSW
jgi:hypothetical protein